MKILFFFSNKNSRCFFNIGIFLRFLLTIPVTSDNAEKIHFRAQNNKKLFEKYNDPKKINEPITTESEK